MDPFSTVSLSLSVNLCKDIKFVPSESHIALASRTNILYDFVKSSCSDHMAYLAACADGGKGVNKYM